MDISILYLMVLAFHATRFPLSSHSHPFRSTAAPVSLHNLRRYARMKVIREAREP